LSDIRLSTVGLHTNRALPLVHPAAGLHRT